MARTQIELFSQIRWVFSAEGARKREHMARVRREALAHNMRKRAGGAKDDSPILLADALGWQLADNGDLACSRETRRQLEAGLVSVAYHTDPRLLELRVGHRLCEGELLGAGLDASCEEAWLLLEALYLPDNELRRLHPDEAAERLWWAPQELLPAFYARHPVAVSGMHEFAQVVAMRRK